MIVLYRNGSTHMVRGVECELKHFNANEFDDAIKTGWRVTPAEEILEEIVLRPVKKKKSKKK